MRNKKINVAILVGGPSAEHDVSLKTGAVVLNALNKNKYNAIPVTVTKEGKWLLPSDDGKELTTLEAGSAIDKLKLKRNADVVFIAMHGTYGEDGTVQGFLELAGIPYTGSGVLASALAMDKLKSSHLFEFHGLKVPDGLGFSAKEWKSDKNKIISEINEKIFLPCVVKPSNCGSSVGITVVKKISDLENAIRLALSYDNTILVQKYVSGAEVTCAVLDEDSDREPIALPPTQIIPRWSEFFDYRAKYIVGGAEEITPARLPAEVIKKIQDTALQAHKIIGCSGMSRTDMIVSDGDIFILEINTIPGMTETSLYPQAAAAVGISFPKLLDKIILSALD